ncbi:MAG TPA: four helix bundle protein [Syntrophales bacterium]|jgi:four helix bundle protein|nr:four helix bundle protein [Syntrophales bacterium]
MKISRFEDLDCWREARVLVQKVYDATEINRFVKDTRLARQIQAAAASSMANIAEGLIRRSDKEFIQFLFIAMSSTAEVRSHLYIALDRGYIDREKFDDIYGQADKTGKMISGLITYLLKSNPKPTKGTRETK